MFSGVGGLDLAVADVLDAETVWVCENNPDAARVLQVRFGVPNLGDVSRIDWSTVPGVDVLTGGFPCQDLSLAGRRAGLGGERSGLWYAMVEAITVLAPSLVVIENVRGMLSAKTDSEVGPAAQAVDEPADVPDPRALGRVLGDLAECGYDARWCGLQASDVGAAHRRYRVFIAAAPHALYGGRSWWPGELRPRWRIEPADGGAAAVPDPGRLGLPGRGGVRDLGGTAHDSGGQARQQRDRDSAGDGGEAVAWGDYEPAIRRWELIVGRCAPSPTEIVKGVPRLSAPFEEWLMGLPAGWVTEVVTVRMPALRLLGGGVVPQQGAAALRHLLGTPLS